MSFALWSWARAQAASGAEVSVLYAPRTYKTGDVPFVSKDPGPGITATSVPHRGEHRMALRPLDLDRYLGRNDLLVLHEGWTPSNYLAARAARKAGVPYVVVPHGVYEAAWNEQLKGPRAVRMWFERRVLERAAAVHLFFESEIPNVKRIAPHATPLVVPTGFDLPADRWTGGGGYLAWLGRVDPVPKGLDVLVGAVARLPAAQRLRIRLHGYDYKGGIGWLRDLIAARGLQEWISIGPAVAGEEKMKFLREADGYLLPSRFECHSIALLENLALGAPCLVSSTIHIAPMLAAAQAAILTAPDEGAIADGLVRLARERQELGARGRALVADTFDWQTLMRRYYGGLARLGLTRDAAVTGAIA